MPRPPRINLPGLIYHVTARGVRRQSLFHDDSDRQAFLRIVLETIQLFPAAIHAYCLMDNHYHLLLQTTRHTLSDFMHRLNTRFAKLFNRQNPAGGHVFQSRFHSIPVQVDTYFATVSRYIHLNPVRAGMVRRPEDHTWSNYRNLILGKWDPIVTDPTFMLGFFSDDSTRQREVYRGFVEDALDKFEPIGERALWRKRSWGNIQAILAQLENRNKLNAI